MSARHYDLVALRHGATVEYLLELGYVSADTPVLPHATAEDVRGRHVLGVLPLHLAALCASLTVLELDLSREARGAELTLDRVRALARGLRTYVVRETANDEVEAP